MKGGPLILPYISLQMKTEKYLAHDLKNHPLPSCTTKYIFKHNRRCILSVGLRIGRTNSYRCIENWQDKLLSNLMEEDLTFKALMKSHFFHKDGHS